MSKKAKPFERKAPESATGVEQQRLLDDARAFARKSKAAKDEVTEASEESFPASDPPSFTPTRAGSAHERKAED